MDELGLELEGLLRQRGWLRALARGLVREGEVDDLLQDSWLAALGARARPRHSLRAWFAGFARNAARGARRRAPGLEHDWTSLADGQPAAGELLARAELQERLIAAVRALREPYRSTVLLRYFEGLALEEVGRRTGVPGSTARTRLQRALAELRERLGRERDTSWALLAQLAHGGAPALPSLALEATLMGTLVKVGTGAALAAGLGLVVWSRVRGADVRGRAIDAESAPLVAAESSALPAVLARAPDAGEVVLRAPVLGEARTGEAEPAPGAPASDPDEARVARSPLERSLEGIAETFLTEEPDAAGLLAVAGDLARWARVVPETLALDEDSGRVSGELALGANLRGSFSIEGAEYRVELEAWSQRPPFFQSALTLGFSADGAVASGTHACVQFHPRTNESASQSIGSEEQLVGWGLHIDPLAGTSLRPITMQAQGAAWRIGQAEAFEPLALPWVANTHSFDLWLERLRPHAPR